MQLGMIGLGRMGANMVRRLMRGGHSCAVYDRAPQAVQTLVDEGATGAVWGLERGYCLMIGGEDEVVQRLDPIFRTLAPGRGDIAPTAGREGRGGTADLGYLHCGASGAGHFVKMVHNGIEYGLMAAYAEGFNLLREANAGTRAARVDAETAPPTVQTTHLEYDLDVAAIAELWRHGSVVRSWLLDLTADALARNASLDAFHGEVADSGEGRWTINAAVDAGVPVPVLATALFARFSSRNHGDFANRLLSAMREEFGGHIERSGSPKR